MCFSHPYDPPTTRQGWRHFRCYAGEDDNPPVCAYEWEEPTRDHTSPSGVNCPFCGEWTFPDSCRPDPTLPVDDSGNLLS